MRCVIKSIIAAAAFAAATGGCATYDYGYSQPYAYSYGYSAGPYYDPYYYSGPAHYYGPGYYVGPPALGFYYYDSHGSRHWSDGHDRGHDGRWSGDRGHDRGGRSPDVGRNEGPADSRPAPAFNQGRDRSITPEAAARAEQHG
jgi:hypothetical protein